MRRMFNLILNENMKIYRQISTKIMLGLLILIVILAGLIFKFNVKPTDQNQDWRTQLTQENMNFQNELSRDNFGMPKDMIEQRIKLNNYRLENNIPPTEGTIWGFIITLVGVMVVFVSIATIIVGSGNVAGEFSSGTIKLYLIRPIKRWKLLLSKYISQLVFALIGLIIVFIASFIVGGIIYSFSEVNQPYLAYSNGNVHEVNMLGHVFTTYMYNCVSLVMMVSLAFMISAVFRSNAMAIGIGIALLIMGNMLVGLLRNFGWVKYVLFANVDLMQYVDGVPIVKGMTMGFSLIVLAVYFAIFNTISWIVFSKRDVAA